MSIQKKGNGFMPFPLSIMMKLYLVRHGQSTGNVGNLHQNKLTPLSDHGRHQAGILAKRFHTIPVDVILASPYARAFETAEIIGKEVGQSVEKNELLRELKRPTIIEGKMITDPISIAVNEMIKTNAHDTNWHYADEENISELLARARTFLESLDSRSEKRILAVSHGRLIQALVEHVILGDALTPHLFEEMKERIYMTNTGITVLEKNATGWHLVTWNDNAHLGNI